jgi:hypothetical protein
MFAATAALAQTPDAPPPAAPATAAPAPSAPPPAAPTGDAAQIISVLNNLCVPALGGGAADKLAPKLGLRKNEDGDWVMRLGGPKRITVVPPNSANPTVCTLTVLYDVGGDAPIYTALNGWALAHPNPYVLAKDHETSQIGDETHVTSTWSAVEADGAEGLLFIQERTADGKPLSGRADEAMILFSIRPS